MNRWAKGIALFAVAVHFIMVLFIILSRINYRYELEWMEGASLIQAYRISKGLALYTQPSLEYIPMIYPPLYFYLAAVLVKITGFSFLPLRIISFASTLGILIVIYRAVKVKTNSTSIAFVAAGSFVSAFRLGGAWFDIARVDMLFTFLCLAGMYCLVKQTIKNSILAGILFSLSFLTKQTAIPIFAVLAVSTFLLFRKQTIPFVGGFVVLTASTYLFLFKSTNGWYPYYILTLPAKHHISWFPIGPALQSGFVIEAVFLMVGISPLVFGIHKVMEDKIHQYYYFASIAFIVTSILARTNTGAFVNVFLPAYAMLAILFGLGLGWLTARYDDQGTNKNLIPTVLWLATAFQFALLAYNPIQNIPTLADRKAGDALVSELKSTQGAVLVPYHNYLALLAGKKAYFNLEAFDEIRGGFSKGRMPESREVQKQYLSTPFSLIIMDSGDILTQIRRCAVTQNIAYESPTAFYPVTGFSVRPAVQYMGCP